MPEAPLRSGAVIGILGGGQLGRMLSVAASRLGLVCHIYDPAPAPPAGQVARTTVTAGWDDTAALARFAAECDRVTFEFENIPLSALDALGCPVLPGRRALEVSQDRLAEKTFIASLGLEVARHEAVETDTLAAALERIGPGILKTRRLGYDGRGQVRLRPGDDPAEAFEAIGGGPAILEGLVDFSCEISVIVARDAAGTVVAYDPGENVHEGGILRTTRVPARLDPDRIAAAKAIAERIATGLDYVGVLGVELFVTGQRLLVNEIAPRVHNSGHWTQNGCVVDQFEQHIRAIAGWPLGTGQRHVGRGHDQPARRRGRASARDRGRTRSGAAPLRQGRGTAGAQDGTRQSPCRARHVTGAGARRRWGR